MMQRLRLAPKKYGELQPTSKLGRISIHFPFLRLLLPRLGPADWDLDAMVRCLNLTSGRSKTHLASTVGSATQVPTPSRSSGESRSSGILR